MTFKQKRKSSACAMSTLGILSNPHDRAIRFRKKKFYNFCFRGLNYFILYLKLIGRSIRWGENSGWQGA